MPTRRVLPLLYLVSALGSVVVTAPILGAALGVGPRYLLYRDAVSTPRSHVTDAMLGIGDVAPRAVPQDWFVATASRVIDGGMLVAAIMVASLVFAGVGYGRLAARLVPSAQRAGAVAASAVAIWNPYVAERLLQGHWGLLVGYAALGWLIVEVLDLPAAPTAARWWRLAGLTAVAGLTPTGSLLAAAALGCTAAGLRMGGRRAVAIAGCWLLASGPWLVAAMVGGATTSSGTGGTEAFGLRAEPGLGALGTALGLGGIWNADAVPTSRTVGWAAVATVCLLIVVGVGGWHLARHRAGEDGRVDAVRRALAILAAVTVIVVVCTAVGPGRALLGHVVESVPGAGLLRDTHKFLALLMPAFAMAVAGAVAALRRRVPAGFALAAVALLVIAPLPDLGWGVGGQIRPIDYPADWRTVAAIVPADEGAVAVWPSDTVRRYDFADELSLDPAPRMLRAPVVESGRLTVDGVEVDPPSARAAEVDRLLGSAGDRNRLAELGVGWVLVEDGSTPAALTGAHPVFAGTSLRLYRIDDPVLDQVSAVRRALVIGAHLVWLTLIVGAAATVALGGVRRIRRSSPRRRPRSRRPSPTTNTGPT